MNIYEELYETYNNLINAWGETPINEQEPIEAAIRAVRGQLNQAPKLIRKFNKELERFDTFYENQSDFDNIISLLKICDRIGIKSDIEIDLENIDIKKEINNIRTLVNKTEYTKTKFNEAGHDLLCLWSAIRYEDEMPSFTLGNSDIKSEDIIKLVGYNPF